MFGAVQDFVAGQCATRLTQTRLLKPICSELRAAGHNSCMRVMRVLLGNAPTVALSRNALALRHSVTGEEFLPHPCLRAGLRVPHSYMLTMAWFCLSSHNLGFGWH
jgi:hypothetical protein